ncbi:hypothetical protein ACFVWP_46920 [Streptomyces sp. NPDC058175]|uniref:hypothetical protein n=1 Tax=Streptomyces sp. NPDC058175 TaxID=3346367 RepID=UPI0036E3224E
MNKARLLANLLDRLAETVLVAATLTVAVILNHLFPTPANDLQVMAIVAVAFVAWTTLSNLMEAAVGPTIDRLRGQTTDEVGER